MDFIDTLSIMFWYGLVVILLGKWLESKGQSLWHLVYLPVIGVFAILVYFLLKNKKKEVLDNGRETSQKI